MDSGTVLHPVQIDQAAGMILRGESFDVEVFVRHIVAVGSKPATSGTHWLRLNWGVIVDCASRGQKRADAIAQPQRSEDV